MIEKVMKAFEAWQAAKEELREVGDCEWACSADIADMREKVADAREAYMGAMDAWFEWKRLNGPQHPGR